MTYLETIKYLESFINYENLLSWPYQGSFKLERFRTFLDCLGNPQASLRSIHVSGSKGKGSTCAFIAYILRAAGYRVGLYTSPHLTDFRERIRILDSRQRIVAGPQREFEGMIGKAGLAELATELKPAIERFNRETKSGKLTFFEVCTALAFVYFKQQKVDFAVLETGLGGRLDATNVADSLVAVITPISYEHAHILGKTLAKIAAEKAGIIKGKGQTAITAPQAKEALKIIRSRAARVGVALIKAKKNIPWPGVKISLLGKHQLINAACAIAAVRGLRGQGIKIDPGAIKSGLENTLWPGRCEVVAQRPLIVLDGAQNVASCRVLKKALRDNFKYKELILVLGVSGDKDIKGICQELCPLAGKVILTRSLNPRAANVSKIEQIISSSLPEAVPRVEKTKNVKEALMLAKLKAGPQDLILVTGSLFVVGEARQGEVKYA